MLTFMKKDHNFDGEDSSIKKEPEPQTEKQNVRFMSWQDLLTLLVIGGLIAGGYFYFKQAKQKAAEFFARCDTAYEAKDYMTAEACYDSTWELGYITDTMELVRQERIGVIKDIRISQTDLLEEVESLLASSDSVNAASKMKSLEGPVLLLGKNLTEWKKLEEVLSSVEVKEVSEVKEVPDSSSVQ